MELSVHATCVDSGGHHTQTVYAYCKERFNRRVYAIKGRSDGPVWPKRAQSNNKVRANVFMVGTAAAKDNIYARLKGDMPGPGYCHFPKGRDAAYFEQLTAEVVQTKYVKGFPTRVYVLPTGKRNEALDLRVYAYAAFLSLNVRWGAVLGALAPKPTAPRADPGETETAPETPPVLRRETKTVPRNWLRRREGGWLR